MEQKLIDTIILARKAGYTWRVIGEHLGMSDSLLRYYVKVNTKPQKPINEWWLENSSDPKSQNLEDPKPSTEEPPIEEPYRPTRYIFPSENMNKALLKYLTEEDYDYLLTSQMHFDSTDTKFKIMHNKQQLIYKVTPEELRNELVELIKETLEEQYNVEEFP